MRNRIAIVQAAGLAISVFAIAGAALAQSAWPTAKPITLVSPYAPGGTTDVLARLLAIKLQEKLGQTIVVENRPGAGGNIGTDYVAKAKPDGYTFMVDSSGPIVIAPSLYPKLPYKPESDLTAIAPLASAAFVVAVNAKAGITSLPDLIERARKAS